MKVIRQMMVVGVFLSTATAGTLVSAQGSAKQYQDEIALTRAIVQAKRQIIVQQNMELSTEESQGFWPVYDNYRVDMAKVNNRRVKLITDYADSYATGSLSDKEALRMLKEFLSVENAKLKVKKRYIRRFRKVLPPKKVVRFFQVDNKLDTVVNAALAKDIPLVR